METGLERLEAQALNLRLANALHSHSDC